LAALDDPASCRKAYAVVPDPRFPVDEWTSAGTDGPPENASRIEPIMQVIRQLIEFFSSRGALSGQQLDFLAQAGFYNPYEEYGQDDEDGGSDESADESGQLPADSWEAMEQACHRRAARRPRGRRSRGRKGLPGTRVKAPEICARIAQQSSSWATQLAGLVALGRRLATCTTWQTASNDIRNTEDTSLQAAVHDAMAERRPGLNRLWPALAMDDYHGVVQARGESGPAVGAYRAVLASTNWGSMVRHAWLLKYPAIRSVYNLAQAQRKTLRACRTTFERDPHLFAVALRRDHEPTAFWSLVLLRNALQQPPAEPTIEQIPYPPRADCPHWGYGPVRWPEERLLTLAWVNALYMGPQEVAALFVRCYQDAAGQHPAHGWLPCSAVNSSAKKVKGNVSNAREVSITCPRVTLQVPVDWLPR
jgi:hypothetical protein